MKQYIQTGERNFSNDKLSSIIKHNIPNLHNENLNTEWYGFAMYIMDNLSTDFNLYMFFTDTMPNMPSKFLFNQFSESVLDLCKLVDKRKNNQVALIKILNNIEQNIKDKDNHKQFLEFKNDITKWLDSKQEFIDAVCTVRDKFIAHIDIDQRDEYRNSMRKISIPEFIDFSNIIIQIYCEIMTALLPSIIPYSYYEIDEFNFIYECLRSLDKIEKNVTEKNRLIHEIDLRLQKIKSLINKSTDD